MVNVPQTQRESPQPQTTGEALQHLDECPMGCRMCQDWRNQYLNNNEDENEDEDVDSIERWG